MKKQIQHLQIGDVLMGSKAKVLTMPTSGVHTPQGKVDLIVQYPNGTQKIKTWGKSTLVTVAQS